MFKTQLRRLPVLPTSVLKEYPSISLCEEKVLKYYKEVAGQSRGAAIVNYLSIIESLPTYGQHYYEIKDKTGSPCWLGLSYKGISQYDKNDRRNPRRVFLWKQLENLYYRDKKFTIEVHEARRVIHTLSSFNLYEDAIEEPVEDYDDLSDAICDPTTQVSVSRRTLAPANVTVYVWYASSPIVTKCIWSMAISQHHFFLDRKHLKSQSSVVPSLSQIASELCRSVQSLSSAGSLSNISRSNSSSSLPSTILGGEITEESKAAAIEMLVALRTRKEALEEVLSKKTEELKVLCLKEGELTGEIPPETPLQPGEVQPQVRRRVGTSFSLSDKFIFKSKSEDRETLNDLELEYEIQSKIASAAFQLMNHCNARKSVRKHRKLTYDQATIKLRDIEHKLCTLKREKNKEKAERKHLEANEVEKAASDKETLDDSGVNLVGSTADSLISPQSVSENSSLKNTLCSSSVAPSSSLPQLTVTECDSVSENPCDIRQRHQSLQQLPYSNVSKSSKGLDENSLYDTCGSVGSSYRSRIEYDSVSCGSASGLPLRVTYRNRFEPRLDIDGSNLYSVPNRRASQVFDSQDDLLLSGRKSGFECQSPVAKAQSSQPVYSNTLPLSASYDERIWYGKSKDHAAVSSDGSSLETSFERHSNNSCDATSLSRFEGSSHKQSSVGSPKNMPECLHFHSENSLHCDESSVTFHGDSVDTSEPHLVQHLGAMKISHVRSVPHLYEELPAKPTHEQFPRNNPCSSVSSHNINQAVDLVQASMLLQESKRTASTCSLKYCSPKAKTKEWIETSLDSPMPPRKQKLKQPPDTVCQNKYQSTASTLNHCKTHPVRLSPHPKSLNHAEPASRHYGRTEIEDSSLQCSNLVLPTLIDTGCDSTHYGSQYSPGEQCPVDCNYALVEHTVEQDHSHLNTFHDNSTSISTTHRFPNVDEISSVYSEFHDPPTLSFTNSSPSYAFSPSYTINAKHPTPLHDPAAIAECTENHLTLQPELPNANYLINPPGVYNAHYVQSNIESVPPCANHQFKIQSPAANCPPVQNPAFDSSDLPLNLCPLTSSTSTLPDCTVVSPQSVTNTETLNFNVSYSHDNHTSQPINVSVAQEGNGSMPPCSPVNFPFPSNVEVNVVSVGHFQPYWEETKPYELSDFYKYSTKHRKHQPKHHADVDASGKAETTNSNMSSSNPEYWTDVPQNTPHYPIEVVKGFALAPKHVPNSLQTNPEILVNAHVAVVDHSDYKKLESNCVFQEDLGKQILNSPPLPSNDDAYNNVRASLADTFHEEMLAWYENRETVKKATLV